MPLVEANESDYLMLKSEQHRLTPKYDILCSLFTRVKHDFVTIYEDHNQFKITFQRCYIFIIYSGSSR